MILARNMAIQLAEPGFEKIKVAGNPIKSSIFDDPERRPAAPGLDADRASLLAELGIAQPDASD